MSLRRSLLPASLVALVLVITSALTASGKSFPESIDLPEGFQPEGIAIGKGTTFYVGSIPSGRIYRGDLATGEGTVLVEPEGRQAIGLAVDNLERVFVAGGPTGAAYVYDGSTGATLATYQLTEAPPSSTTSRLRRTPRGSPIPSMTSSIAFPSHRTGPSAVRTTSRPYP